MKAIVLHQPYASLVALGVKTWETRPSPPNGPMRPAGVRGLPGLAIDPGERIAIVAGRRKPKEGAEAGGYAVESWRDEPSERCLVHADDLAGRRLVHQLPLGAVVCTVEVAEALPMVSSEGFDEWTWDDTWPAGVMVVDRFDLARFAPGTDMFAGEDISDQLPYGDWQPGRWAWRLDNVEPCEPVPVTGRQGVFRLHDDVAERMGRAS